MNAPVEPMTVADAVTRFRIHKFAFTAIRRQNEYKRETEFFRGLSNSYPKDRIYYAEIPLPSGCEFLSPLDGAGPAHFRNVYGSGGYPVEQLLEAKGGALKVSLPELTSTFPRFLVLFLTATHKSFFVFIRRATASTIFVTDTGTARAQITFVARSSASALQRNCAQSQTWSPISECAKMWLNCCCAWRSTTPGFSMRGSASPSPTSSSRPMCRVR